MRRIGLVLVGLIALLHLYIAYFEMFAWETRGPEVFSSFPKELFPDTVTLAANQGLYNAFLAAGLIWALFITERKWQTNVATFFLLCVAVAGIFGAATASFSILYVQTVPSVAGLICLFLAKKA